MMKYFQFLVCIIFSLGTLSCGHLSHTYLIKKGETLEKAARRYGLTISDILKYNQYAVNEGDQVVIPVMTRDAFLASQSKHYFAPKRDFIWPVLGLVSSPFGRRWGKMHEGIDIKAPEGTPIRAVQSGVIIYSGNEVSGYGNLIAIAHKGGFTTVYAHNRVNLVVAGDKVLRGQVIGQVGRSGHATGDHLHFEVRKNGDAHNPIPYLTKSVYVTKR